MTTLLCHRPNPPCPTTHPGDILTPSSSPRPWGRGHPPLGQVLHLLPRPPASSRSRGVVLPRCPLPVDGVQLGLGDRGQERGCEGGRTSWLCQVWALLVGSRTEPSLSANVTHGEAVRCLLPSSPCPAFMIERTRSINERRSLALGRKGPQLEVLTIGGRTLVAWGVSATLGVTSCLLPTRPGWRRWEQLWLAGPRSAIATRHPAVGFFRQRPRQIINLLLINDGRKAGVPRGAGGCPAATLVAPVTRTLAAR